MMMARRWLLGLLLLPGVVCGAEDARLGFEGGWQAGPVRPLVAEGLTQSPGHTGDAVGLGPDSKLAIPAPAFLKDGFDLRLWVRHEQALTDYRYDELVYLYHETPNWRNRICLLKRAGTDYLLFSLSDDTGAAKGADFAGNWFAMKSPPLQWAAGTWHELRVTASRARGEAALYVDGRCVAAATGTQFPQVVADRLWLGSLQGRSQMRGTLDDVTIAPAAGGLSPSDRAAVAQGAAPTTPDRGQPPVPAAPGTDLSHGKEITLNLDFFDVSISTDTWDMADHRGEMDRIMRLAAHAGVDRILFRVSICGVVCYRSKVMYVADDKAFINNHRELLDTPVANTPCYIPRMADLMKATDPLRDCVELGHKYGLKVWGWITVYDSLYYAPEGEFFHDHPEYTWVSRDGTRHIPGVPCYAYPEVRELRLKEIEEILSYGVDGIYLCMRSHSPWPKDGSGAREYGYNPPVIAEYQRRYGSDPRQARPGSLEELRFVKLQGEFLKQFLTEAHKRCQARGKLLSMNASWDAVDPATAARMYVPADDLCREHIVDELCILSGANADLTRWRVLGRNRVRLTTFTGMFSPQYEVGHAAWVQGLQQMLRNPTLDGTCFHEFGNVLYFHMWDDIRRVVAEWRRETRQEAARP